MFRCSTEFSFAGDNMVQKNDESVLKQILSKSVLRSQAGSIYYSRGEEYFKDGNVRNLEIDTHSASAVVTGTHNYKVSLSAANGILRSSCNCPLGRDGEFCKHKVALGLACLNNAEKKKHKSVFHWKNFVKNCTREELEKTLLDYSGTMLIVSHDRYFINKIADRILLLTNNGVKEYLGNYDYYLERTTAEKSGAVPTENKKDKKEKTQNDYFLQKQKQSEERKRQTKLKKAEAEIERLDEEIAKTQELLSSEEVAADYEKLMELSKLLEDLQKQQEGQYEIWEELESMAE